jgi:hypothetical protein
MFCPRCGLEIDEGLKFCRNCGLPLSQVTTYVASGGTNELTAFNPPPVPLSKLGFTPKQVLTLRIAGVLISPALVAILQELLGFPEEIIAITAIVAPFLILLAYFRYRSEDADRGSTGRATPIACPLLQSHYLAPRTQTPRSPSPC